MDTQQVITRLTHFEGCENFMYRCTGGEVTIGIGHAIPSAADAVALPWEIGGQPAPPSIVQSDFTSVAAAPKGLFAGYYAALSQCRLSDANIRVLVAADVERFQNGCKAAFPNWNSYPEPVQQALFDMAFNLGIGGLKKFVNMWHAIDARDWEAAARESARNGISPERNAAIAALFRQAAPIT